MNNKSDNTFYITLIALGIFGIIAILLLKGKGNSLTGLGEGSISKDELDKYIQKSIESSKPKRQYHISDPMGVNWEGSDS